MYQALYRKWRPKTFDEVIGQPHITETLKNQIITGRLSHAYLFIGTRGTGKTTCAKILAKALNCEHPENGNPCCKCPACLGIDDGSVLDVVEIDAASNNGVDNVRQLRDEAVFSPVSVKKRVYIIDEVHMLSTAAFNALLKILEEPPEHLCFILATTELNKVPATILSRCQRHSFKRLDARLIAAHLEHVAQCEGLELEKSAAELIAGLAEGGMRDALSLLDQCSGQAHISVDTVYSCMGLTGNRRTAKLLDMTIKRDTDSALALFNELWSDGKDPVTLLGELNTLQRDCLMMSVAPHSGAGLISGGYTQDVLNVFVKKLTSAELISRIDTVAEYIAKAKDSKSTKLTAELCLISLCDPTLCDSVEALRARISRLEQGVRSIPSAGGVEDYDDVLYDDPPPPKLTDRIECADEPEIDPAQFAEYQPEDDFLDKASPAKLNPDAPAQAADAPSDSGAQWSMILEHIEDKYPTIYHLMKDANTVRGNVSYDALDIYAVPGFTFTALNKQDIIIRIREVAGEVTGRSLKVALHELSDSGSKKPTRDLEDLRRFKETRFI